MNAQVDEYIAQQKEETAAFLSKLRKSILSISDLCEEQFSYKVPFYYFINKPICYFHVSSENTIIGFYNGRKLTERPGFLEHFGRKQVKLIFVNDFSEFDFDLFKEIIIEAMMTIEKKI